MSEKNDFSKKVEKNWLDRVCVSKWNLYKKLNFFSEAGQA